MQPVKQKVSDGAAVAKEHVDIFKAKAQEKAEKATARTKEEKEIAHEHRKAKEAEAEMKMHDTKAEHAAEKLYGYHHHHGPAVAGPETLGHHGPVVPTTTTGAVTPNYYPQGPGTGPN